MTASAVLLLLAILALLPGNLAVPLADQCTAERVQQHLNAASQLFKECGDNFAFHDCCQVSTYTTSSELCAYCLYYYNCII